MKKPEGLDQEAEINLLWTVVLEQARLLRKSAEVSLELTRRLVAMEQRLDSVAEAARRAAHPRVFR